MHVLQNRYHQIGVPCHCRWNALHLFSIRVQAERDVRIEEEQAEMGESEKAAEERQLMAELVPLVCGLSLDMISHFWDESGIFPP